jgi:hypothetical protein
MHNTWQCVGNQMVIHGFSNKSFQARKRLTGSISVFSILGGSWVYTTPTAIGLAGMGDAV